MVFRGEGGSVVAIIILLEVKTEDLIESVDRATNKTASINVHSI